MLSATKAINRFYRSNKWQAARNLKISSAHGLCEKCGAVGEEVHHIIHLNAQNIYDVNVTLNQANLLLLCKACHNEEHNRFVSTKPKFDKNGNLIPY